MVELTDELMDISKYNILDQIVSYKSPSKFVSDIGDNFTIVVFFY